MSKKGLVTVLSGFSGAGKGTIMKHLLNKYPGTYNLSISATTRKKRTGEEDGREYFFKSVPKFEEMIKNGELLEYAKFNDNYYGTPKAYVEKLLNDGEDVEGKIVRFEVDEVRKNALGYYVIWAGDHLNFMSEDDPDVKEGEKVTVEITEVQNVLGSWIISYEFAD